MSKATEIVIDEKTLSKAILHLRKEKYSDAIKLLEPSINNLSAKNLYNLAFAYYKEGNIGGMETTLAKAKTLNFDPITIIKLSFEAGEELLSKAETLEKINKTVEMFKSIIDDVNCPVIFKMNVNGRLHQAYEKILHKKESVQNIEATTALSQAALEATAKNYEDAVENIDPTTISKMDKDLALSVYKKLGYLMFKKACQGNLSNSDKQENAEKAATYLHKGFEINEKQDLKDIELYNNLAVVQYKLAEFSDDEKDKEGLIDSAESFMAYNCDLLAELKIDSE